MGVVSGFNHENGLAVLSEEGSKVTPQMALIPHPFGGEPAGSAGLLALSLYGTEGMGREHKCLVTSSMRVQGVFMETLLRYRQEEQYLWCEAET